MTPSVEQFAEYVRNAPGDRQAEQIVRIMLEKVAKNCPVHILVQLGNCLVACRKSELRNEAEKN
jgi:hypothetical protein